MEFYNGIYIYIYNRRNLSTGTNVEISYLKKKRKNNSRLTKNSYIFKNVRNKYYTENDFILTYYYPVCIKFNKTIFDIFKLLVRIWLKIRERIFKLDAVLISLFIDLDQICELNEQIFFSWSNFVVC